MAKNRSWLLVSLFLTEVLLLDGGIILTIATLGECLLGMQSLVAQDTWDNVSHKTARGGPYVHKIF